MDGLAPQPPSYDAQVRRLRGFEARPWTASHLSHRVAASRVGSWPGSTATRTASRTSGPPTCSTSPAGRGTPRRATGPGSWSTSAAGPPARPPRCSAGRSSAWDVWARRTRIVDTAQRALDAPRRGVAGLRHGVRRGRQRRAARGRPRAPARSTSTPARWEPWTPLAVFHAQHLLFASAARQALAPPGPGGARPRRGAAVARPGVRLGQQRLGGRRRPDRDSGKPLIGGDPHRVFESPGVYAQVRLACEDPTTRSTSSGSPSPGVPGVQHFAHAGAGRVGDHQRGRPTTRTSSRSRSTTWSTATRRRSRSAAPTR